MNDIAPALQTLILAIYWSYNISCKYRNSGAVNSLIPNLFFSDKFVTILHYLPISLILPLFWNIIFCGLRSLLILLRISKYYTALKTY